MYAWFTVPTASSVISSSTEYASSVFTEFLPLLYVAIGIVAAVVLLKYLRSKVSRGIGSVGRTGGRRRGHRR